MQEERQRSQRELHAKEMEKIETESLLKKTVEDKERERELVEL